MLWVCLSASREETREVIRRAQQEARAMGHGAVGTEHLVLALTGVDGGIVAEVFAELGITSDACVERCASDWVPARDRADRRTGPVLSAREACAGAVAARSAGVRRPEHPARAPPPRRQRRWVRAAAARSSARWVRART